MPRDGGTRSAAAARLREQLAGRQERAGRGQDAVEDGGTLDNLALGDSSRGAQGFIVSNDPHTGALGGGWSPPGSISIESVHGALTRAEVKEGLEANRPLWRCGKNKESVTVEFVIRKSVVVSQRTLSAEPGRFAACVLKRIADLGFLYSRRKTVVRASLQWQVKKP